MRINAVKKRLQDEHVDDIQRRYPLVSPEAWPGNLTENRANLWSGDSPVYPLLQRPIIECIPQYIRDTEHGNVGSLHQNPEIPEDVRKRLEGIIPTLEKSMFKGWTLFPHQWQSLVAYLEDKHVMVATGTGSGKTESFLLPILAHLHESAVREKPEGGGPVDDAVRCLILYPMNALVADQLSRIRHMLGHRSTSKHLHDIGLGRNPRFGMYTSRTPYHGWYAKKKGERWHNSHNKPKLKDIHETYLSSKSTDRPFGPGCSRRGKYPPKDFECARCPPTVNSNQWFGQTLSLNKTNFRLDGPSKTGMNLAFKPMMEDSTNSAFLQRMSPMRPRTPFIGNAWMNAGTFVGS